MDKLALGLQYVSIIIITLECFYIFNNLKSKLHGILFMNSIAILMNNYGDLFEMKTTTSEGFFLATAFSFFGRMWIPFTIMFFSFEICNIKLKKRVIAPIMLVNTILYIFVASSRVQPYFFKKIEYVQSGIFPHNEYQPGIVFFIYLATVAAALSASLIVVVRQYLGEKSPLSRKRLMLIIIAIVIEAAFYICKAVVKTSGYDISMIGHTITTIIICVAIVKYNLLEAVALTNDDIINEMGEAVIVCDISGRVEYFNDMAKTIFPDMKIGYSEVVATIEECYLNEEDFKTESMVFSVGRKDLLSKTKLYGYVFVLTDITDRAFRMAELENAKIEADNANNAKSAFLASMSHEIRTPMNVIVGMADIVIRENEKNSGISDETKMYLDNIKRSSGALLSLINDILDFSKIEAGKLRLINNPYDPVKLLDEIKYTYLGVIGEKSLTLDFDVDENLPHLLLGDENRVRQIISNILSNAAKFTESGGINLLLRCEKLKDSVVKIKCTIKDTGIGIKPENMEKLFQSFSTLNNVENHSKEGSGLGLAICKTLVELMGGTIRVESEYGVGSSFSFEIFQKEVDEATATRINEVETAERSFKAPKAKILIVDDNELNLTVALGLLKSLEMEMDTAANGEDAILKVCNKHYDIVFMDHMMPVMDGLEATSRIRNLDDDYYRTLPIIALSANVTQDAQDNFINVGMNDFVAKPIHIDEICHVIRKWLPSEYIEELDDSQDTPGDKPEEEAFEVEGLNTKEAIEYCGGKDLFIKLMGDYYRIIDKKKAEIEMYLETGKIREYTIEVHALKNTSRMIGAGELSANFYTLEKLGNEENVEAIKPIHEETMKMFSALKPVLKPFADKGKENKKEVGVDEIKDVLSQIKEASDGFDYDTASMGVDMLDGFLLPQEIEDDFEEMKDFMVEVAMDKVSILCEQMINKL